MEKNLVSKLIKATRDSEKQLSALTELFYQIRYESTPEFIKSHGKQVAQVAQENFASTNKKIRRLSIDLLGALGRHAQPHSASLALALVDKEQVESLRRIERRSQTRSREATIWSFLRSRVGLNRR